MEELLKIPTILAALITGIIAIVGTIIQGFISFSRNSFDVKTNYEKTLKEKLENIYSPLTMLISSANLHSNLLDSGEVISLVNRYGYLLSKELFEDFQELNRLERYRPSSDEIDSHVAEYTNLRLKINFKVKKEFDELQNLYSNNFVEYKDRFSISWFKKVISIFVKICSLATLSFWMIFFAIYVISLLNFPENGAKENNLNFFISILLLIIMITTAFYLLYLFKKFIMKKAARLNKWYTQSEYVPKTGHYKCKVCGKNKKLVKNSRFPFCHEKMNAYLFLRFLFIYHHWAYIEDVSKISNEELDNHV